MEFGREEDTDEDKPITSVARPFPATSSPQVSDADGATTVAALVGLGIGSHILSPSLPSTAIARDSLDSPDITPSDGLSEPRLVVVEFHGGFCFAFTAPWWLDDRCVSLNAERGLRLNALSPPTTTVVTIVVVLEFPLDDECFDLSEEDKSAAGFAHAETERGGVAEEDSPSGGFEGSVPGLLRSLGLFLTELFFPSLLP